LLPPKLLLRAAGQLHASSLAMGACAGTLEQAATGALANVQRRVAQATGRLERARRLGLRLVVPRLREGLLVQVTKLQDAVQLVCTCLLQPPPPLPDLRTLVAELRQLEAEFEQVQVDFPEKRLTAATEPITLEDVSLGAFAIRLDWKRLRTQGGVDCFTVAALDPHPAISDRSVTHPHVKRERLCAGEAQAPLRRALEQGRLADAFFLVRSVLRTYNPESPHVALKGWDGDDCRDCGCGIGGDDSCYCPACDSDFCTDCCRDCEACGATRCLNCLTRCEICGTVCCPRCLRSSAQSGQECCPGCLCTCPGCGAPVGKDELSAGTRLCPACRPPARPAVAGAPATGVSTPTPPTTNPEEDHGPTEEAASPAPV
jgi:hypothetical protein